MRKIFAKQWLMVIALQVTFVAGCDKPEQLSNNVILPGILNLPVLEGIKFSDKCLPTDDNNIIPEHSSACISFSGEKIKSTGDLYTQELIARGWVFKGENGISLIFEKPTKKNNCSTALIIVAGAYGKRTPGKIEYGTFNFIALKDPLCDEDRYLEQ